MFWVVLFIQNSLGIGIFEGVFTSMIVAAIPVKNEAWKSASQWVKDIVHKIATM